MLLDKFFKDNKGKIVIIQPPNLPIIGWFVFMVIAFVIPSGILKTGFSSFASAFLFL